MLTNNYYIFNKLCIYIINLYILYNIYYLLKNIYIYIYIYKNNNINNNN